jgi:hypothetical protein
MRLYKTRRGWGGYDKRGFDVSGAPSLKVLLQLYRHWFMNRRAS